MTADLTSYDPALKQIYTSDHVEDMTYKDRPFYALIPKKKIFGGKNLPIPIVYGNPQGRSKTFSNAQARSLLTQSNMTDFVLTRVRDYSLATIDNETMLASKGDKASFLDAAETEMDGAYNSLANSWSAGFYRGSDAALAQVLAEPTENSSTFVLTVKKAADIAHFEVGQMLVIYSAKSGGSIRTSDGSDDEWEVAAVDRSAGTITVTGTYDSSGTIAANDYMFIEGDRGLGPSGLEDWIPASAPTSSSYFGVDRSVDPTRLGGHRLSGTGGPIEEVLAEASSMVDNLGFQLDHFFMPFAKLLELKNSLGSKVQYVNLQANPRVSFQGVMIDGSKGPIKCVADKDCPGDRIFGVELKYWSCYSLGEPIRVLSPDGIKWLRQASADGAEVRLGGYLQVGCRAPGSAINIQV